MRSLGFLYENEQGGLQDYGKARDWFEKAAAVGDAAAVVSLGLLYENGEGGLQDYAKARDWFEKAAATGDTFAMRSLGSLYQSGQGGLQDYAKARDWFEKSAATGDTFAMRSLGSLYQSGQGGQPDYVKARNWFERAAVAGDTAAMRSLGLGAPKDVAKAREWIDKAGSRNCGHIYGNMSDNALLAHDFPRALTSAELAHSLDPDKLWIEVNHAHALMFLNRVANDFARFRKVGLTNPLMEDVETALAAKTQ